MHWDESTTTAANARERLPKLVDAYFEEGRQVVAPGADFGALHQLRLATKQLRYTLELFRGCYGPGLEARIEALRTLQEILGQVSDCTSAQAVLAGYIPSLSPERGQVEEAIRRRLNRAAAQFRRYWRTDFDAPGKQAGWKRYLSAAAR